MKFSAVFVGAFAALAAAQGSQISSAVSSVASSAISSGSSAASSAVSSATERSSSSASAGSSASSSGASATSSSQSSASSSGSASGSMTTTSIHTTTIFYQYPNTFHKPVSPLFSAAPSSPPPRARLLPTLFLRAPLPLTLPSATLPPPTPLPTPSTAPSPSHGSLPLPTRYVILWYPHVGYCIWFNSSQLPLWTGFFRPQRTLSHVACDRTGTKCKLTHAAPIFQSSNQANFTLQTTMGLLPPPSLRALLPSSVLVLSVLSLSVPLLSCKRLMQ
ncbi:unnamed protein product [Aureobasidium pullulans]|nr:unnamed protein product [Aureobasidium pullulans]